MTKLITSLLGWIGRKFVTLTVIVLILALGAWFNLTWKKFWENRQTAGAIEERIDNINKRIAEVSPGRASSEVIRTFTNLDQLAKNAVAEAHQARAARDHWKGEYEWWGPVKHIIAPDKYAHYVNAEAQLVLAETASKLAETARDSFAKETPIPELLEEKTRYENELTLIQDRISQDPRQKVLAAIYAQLPTGLWILFGIIITPVFVRTFFYYILAPLASKQPSIQILASASEHTVTPLTKTSVSQSFIIPPEEEILVHSDFLQISDTSAKKATQWFLNSSIPLSSVASGMCLLTRLRPSETGETKVSLSSQKDALGEISALHLPQGAAMVLQPRALAGVIKLQNHSLQITRHWHLGLHAWLTLQFRYLVFHGPCTLILKGCRGIRAEETGQKARIINQSATIAFSANLHYQTVRCETFIAYLRGKEDLFNDLFVGSPGIFVYEEFPAHRQRKGITGRGLEGVLDAALKAFGV